jgi:hypothetical protein
MTITAFTLTGRRELANRRNGGLEIILYWHANDNSISIDIHQESTEETMSFPVPADQALDAFDHPFAYLASKGDDR